MKRHMEDPKNKEAFLKRTQEGLARAMKTEKFIERKKELGREANQRWAKISIQWCPVEYRDIYRNMTKKKFTAAEARAMTEEMIRHDQEKYLKTGILPQANRR